MAAALAGAHPVIAVDTVESKFASATAVGATHGVLAGDEAVDEVRELTRPGAARQRLQGFVHAALDPGRDDVTAVWVDAWSLGRRNGALAAAVREQAGAWRGHAETIVRDGIRAGEFADVDASDVAWLLIGLVDGLNAQSVVHDRHDPARFLRLHVAP